MSGVPLVMLCSSIPENFLTSLPFDFAHCVCFPVSVPRVAMANRFYRTESSKDLQFYDSGAAARRNNVYTFEIAWEVANKVGGEYALQNKLDFALGIRLDSSNADVNKFALYTQGSTRLSGRRRGRRWTSWATSTAPSGPTRRWPPRPRLLNSS